VPSVDRNNIQIMQVIKGGEMVVNEENVSSHDPVPEILCKKLNFSILAAEGLKSCMPV